MQSEANINNYIGQVIRAFRKRHQLTLNNMADKMKVSYQQLQKYEHGTNRISAENLYKIASILGVDISNFFPQSITGGVSQQIGMIRDGEVKMAVLNLLRVMSTKY